MLEASIRRFSIFFKNRPETKGIVRTRLCWHNPRIWIFPQAFFRPQNFSTTEVDEDSLATHTIAKSPSCDFGRWIAGWIRHSNTETNEAERLAG